LPTEPASAGRGRLWLLGALTALAPLSIDTYLPGLPAISRELRAGTSAVQLTLGACLLGLAAGQLLGGPISDSRGRRGPLRLGLATFAIASLACAGAPTLQSLVALRLIQGAAAAVTIVLARAIVADLYTGADRARTYARLLSIGGVVPVAAPVLGAQLLKVGSWRVIFVAIVIGGGCLLAAVWHRLPESLPPGARRESGTRVAAAGLRSLVRDPLFRSYTLVQGLAFAAMFGYIAAAPFIVQDRYRLPTDAFSAIFALNALGIIIAAQAGQLALAAASSRQLLAVGLGILGWGATGLLGAVILGSNPWAVLPALFLIVASIGLILPHASALALATCAPKEIGSASALLGTSQFAIGGALVPAVGLMGSHSILPLALCIALLAGGAITAFPTTARHSSVGAPIH